MTPCFSVGQATTPRLSFAEALTAYSEAGADGIGIIDRPQLWADGKALDRLRASGLEAGFCILSTTSILPLPDLGGAYAGSEDPERRVAEICASVVRLASFEPQFCMCSPGPRGTYDDGRAREIVVDGFRRAARVAADVGVTIALEPFHPSLERTFSFGNSIPEAVALLADIGEPNTGILFDVWHLWDSADVLRQIREHAAEFVGVHLDDWRDPTRSWCDRVLPGDGLADLPGILCALADGGFSGWYELEILSDDGTFGNDFPDSLSKRDPVELIREGREKFLSAWTASRRGIQ
jgi:sugar phosphate isomerase/epimerase